MRELFNEAVGECGCKGTNYEATDFAKAVDKYVEEGKKLPPAFLKNIKKKKDAAKKEEVEEESFEVTEAAKKRKPYEEVYYKWFDRVSVDIMDIGKIAKEIQAALDSKADLEKVMPELVKKYRKN
jgi:protein tyrosine phosphatase